MKHQKDELIQKLSETEKKQLKKSNKLIKRIKRNPISERRKRKRIFTQKRKQSLKKLQTLNLKQILKKKYQQIKNQEFKFVRMKKNSIIQLKLPQCNLQLADKNLRKARNMSITRYIKQKILKQPKEKIKKICTNNSNKQKQKFTNRADLNFVMQYLRKQLQNILNHKIQQKCVIKLLTNLNSLSLLSLFQSIERLVNKKNKGQIKDDTIHMLWMMRKIQCRALLAYRYTQLIKKVNKISKETFAYYLESQQQQQTRIFMKIKQILLDINKAKQDKIQKLVTLYDQYLNIVINRMNNQEILINKQLELQLQNIQKLLIDQAYLYACVDFDEKDIGLDTGRSRH